LVEGAPARHGDAKPGDDVVPPAGESAQHTLRGLTVCGFSEDVIIHENHGICAEYGGCVGCERNHSLGFEAGL
jgi:hypothetical protein